MNHTTIIAAVIGWLAGVVMAPLFWLLLVA